MKLTKFAYVAVIGTVLTLAAAGCRKNPGYVTQIPGARTEMPRDLQNPQPIPPSPPVIETNQPPEEHPQINPEQRKDWPRDPDLLKADTVHFAFDSSAVRPSEKPKVAAVADYLKANPRNALEIDGHCDERGTEEYNRALGERRALALREALVQMGIDPLRMDTVTYGKDRPIDPGHNDAAWAKNRRGEFLVELAPK
jgi:peptidoglycan-associated lipoprotein